MLGIGLASLFSDWSHEIATTVMPAFLATMGVAAAWLGIIEGVSDGLSSFAKMASGYYTDKLPRRKPIAVAGYLVTALGTAAFGGARPPRAQWPTSSSATNSAKGWRFGCSARARSTTAEAAVLPILQSAAGAGDGVAGRGVRTPVRKALLAAAVTPETYGRAFGFERMTRPPQLPCYGG